MARTSEERRWRSAQTTSNFLNPQMQAEILQRGPSEGCSHPSAPPAPVLVQSLEEGPHSGTGESHAEPSEQAYRQRRRNVDIGGHRLVDEQTSSAGGRRADCDDRSDTTSATGPGLNHRIGN